MENIKKYSSFINESKKGSIYKSVIMVEVLSDSYSRLDDSELSLSNIEHMITEGDWSGLVKIISKNEKLTGKEAVETIKEQGSDPEFFQIDDDGNEIEQ